MSEANPPVTKSRSHGRRWWIAGILLMFIAVFPTIEGPAMYAYTRGWLPRELERAISRTLDFAIGRSDWLNHLRDDNRRWWRQLAIDHRGWSVKLIIPSHVNELEIQFHSFFKAGSGGGATGSVSKNGEEYWWCEVFDGRRLIIEEKQILWNGDVLVDIPPDTKLLEIKYIEGETDIEINGHSFPLDE